MRRALLILLTFSFFATAPGALAGGGSYTFASGTPVQQSTVHAALEASTFDWGLIPRTITVHIGPYGTSYSTYGDVYLDGSLLDAGRFSWGVVQHEMAHQVDFFLFDDAKRARLSQILGGKDWCYSIEGLAHSDHGCERFASELAWAYWESPDNSMRPATANDEAASAPAAVFRAVLNELIGAPNVLPAAAPATKAYAPAAKRPKPSHVTARRGR
jgi:hypothetical protein